MTAIAWLFWVLLITPTAEKTSLDEAEKFIVYVQPTDSFFEKTALVELQKMADDRNIRLEKIDPNRSGGPADITSTPAIVYQNALGRSVFAGRWTEFSTVKNFFRSVKLSPQKTSTIRRDSIFLIEKGRFRQASKIKLTQVSGASLAAFGRKKMDEKAFRRAAFRAIEKGLGSKKGFVTADLRRTDRTFYFDFHPFLAENGQFFVTAELFSQFNCHEPIFTSDQKPLVGDFKNFEKTMLEAAQLLAAETEKALRFSKIGDAANPISVGEFRISESLEPEILGRFSTEKEVASAVTLDAASANPYSVIRNPQSGKWLAAGPIDADVPACLFRFAEPLDRYSGEVREVSGSLQLFDNQRVMRGNFSAAFATLTTGGQSLDTYILGKYLESNAFPTADFQFETAVFSSPLEVGKTSEAKIEGLFRLKNLEKKVVVETAFTPISENQIAVEAHFSINVEDDFGLSTPDGPDETRKFVEVNLHFLLRAE